MRRSFAVAALAAMALLAVYWRPLHDSTRLAAAYGARMGCSCRFVAGRTLGDCRKDFEPGMRMVWLSADEDARRVTARVPLLATQRASYRPGWGCQLEPFGS